MLQGKIIGSVAGVAMALSVMVPAASATATTGPQTIRGYDTGSQGPEGPPIISSLNVARGVVNGVGYEELHPSLDPSGNTDPVDFVYPRGRLFALVNSISDASIDPLTCFGQAPLTGTVTVVGGTGAYKDATGALNITGTLILRAARDHGRCSETDVIYFTSFTLRGDIRLP